MAHSKPCNRGIQISMHLSIAEYKAVQCVFQWLPLNSNHVESIYATTALFNFYILWIIIMKSKDCPREQS